MDEFHNKLQTPELIINKNGSQVRTLYKERSTVNKNDGKTQNNTNYHMCNRSLTKQRKNEIEAVRKKTWL